MKPLNIVAVDDYIPGDSSSVAGCFCYQRQFPFSFLRISIRAEGWVAGAGSTSIQLVKPRLIHRPFRWNMSRQRIHEFVQTS